MAGTAVARAVRRPAPTGDRAPVHRRLQRHGGSRRIPLCRLRRRALPLGREVPLRLGLAELRRAGRARRRRDDRRHEPRDGAHRGRLRDLRRSPGSCLRRRPAADGPAVLHQLVRARPGARRRWVSSPPTTHLGAIRLRVGDPDRLQRFYEEAIGLRTLSSDDGVAALGVDGRPLVELEARSRRAAAGRRTRPGSSTSRSSSRPGQTSRERSAASLPTGWRLSGASDHLVSEALYLSDPEGNGIELYRDRPRDEWPVADGVPEDGHAAARPRQPALGGRRRRRRRRHARGHRCSATSISRSPTSARPRRSGSMRWGSTSRCAGYPGALFASAGGYHHHVGLNTWAGVGRPAAAGGRARASCDSSWSSRTRTPSRRRPTGSRRSADVELVDDGVLASDPSGNAVLLRR